MYLRFFLIEPSKAITCTLSYDTAKSTAKTKVQMNGQFSSIFIYMIELVFNDEQ